MNWESFLSNVLPSVILGGIGIWITYKFQKHQQRLSNDQMMKDLFTEFNGRYDSLNDILHRIKNEFSTIDKLEDADDKEKLKQAIYDFFNLCAEEYYWYKKNRIDNDIWKSWHIGMNLWYNNVPVIKSLWLLEKEEDDGLSYYISKEDEFFDDKS